MGLVVNRPLETTVKEAWEQVSEEGCLIESPLHQGGPCEGPLMVVHADAAAGQMEVIPGLYFTTDRETVERLVGENTAPMKFFVGYSGWGPGQLENELERADWIVAPATDALVFAPPHDLWDEIMRAAMRAASIVGLNPKVVPEDPSFN
jgi:putative transcriptional regulator